MHAVLDKGLFALVLSLCLCCMGCNEGEMKLDSKSSGGGGSSKSFGVGNNSTPEKFAKAVLDTLAKNDKNEFQRIICPSKQELVQFLRTNAVATSESERRRTDRATELVERRFDSNRRTIFSSFDRTRAFMTRDRFDWMRLAVTKTDYHIRERAGIKTMTGIYVYINDGTRFYRLKIDDTMFVNGSWYSINDGLKIYRDVSRTTTRPIRKQPFLRP